MPSSPVLVVVLTRLVCSTFIEEEGVRLIGVEPAGHGIETGKHGALIGHALKGIYLGMVSYLMQDNDGQVEESHSISAGLDFPSVGPQHALPFIHRSRRNIHPSPTKKPGCVSGTISP